MKRTGIEPQFICELIDLNGDSTFFGQTEYTLAQSPFPAEVLPLVQAFEPYTSVAKTDGFGSLETINVTFNDFFGYFKQAMETANLRNYRAKVYLVVKQPPLKPVVSVLLDGRISDPIVWDEQKRTIQLGLIANVTAQEFGFVPDWVDYDYLQQNVVDGPWPHVFGGWATHRLYPICNVPPGQLDQTIVIQSPAEDGTFFDYGQGFYPEGTPFLQLPMLDLDRFPAPNEGPTYYEISTPGGNVLFKASNYMDDMHPRLQMAGPDDWNIPYYTNVSLWSPEQYNGSLAYTADDPNYIPNTATMIGYGSLSKVDTFNIYGEISSWPGGVDQEFPFSGFNNDQEPWLKGLYVFFTAFQTYTQVNNVQQVEYVNFWGRVIAQSGLTLILGEVTNEVGEESSLSGYRPCFIHYAAPNRLFYPSPAQAMCGGGNCVIGNSQGRWPEPPIKIQSGQLSSGTYQARPDGSGLYDRIYAIPAGAAIRPINWWPTMVYPLTLDLETDLERVSIKMGDVYLSLNLSQFFIFSYKKGRGWEIVTADLDDVSLIPPVLAGMDERYLPNECTFLLLRPSSALMMVQDLYQNDNTAIYVSCRNDYNTDEKMIKFIIDKYTTYTAAVNPDPYYHNPVKMLVRKKESVPAIVARIAWENAKIVKLRVNHLTLVDLLGPLPSAAPVFNEGNVENGGLQLSYTPEEGVRNCLQATAMDGWVRGRFMVRNEESITRLTLRQENLEIGFNRVFSRMSDLATHPPDPLNNTHWEETQGDLLTIPPLDPDDPPTYEYQKHFARGYNRVLYFWLYDYSHSWMKVNFNTFIDSIYFNNSLLVGSDVVNVNFQGALDFIEASQGSPLNVTPKFGSGSLPQARGLILEITIDPNEWTISMSVKLPIQLGTNVPQYVVEG